MKRITSQYFLVLLLLFVCFTFAVGQVPDDATAIPDHITLTWTGDTATTMTVTWRTDTTVTAGFIQYHKDNGLTKSIRAVASDFTTDLGTTRLFTATITSLSPNTRYSYRVGNLNCWSETHTFSTTDPKARMLKFIVFGDSQSDSGGKLPYGLWHDTVHNAYKANPDARFIVNVGDLVDIGQSGAHWNAWFTAAAGVIDTIPEMPLEGNHETGGSKSIKKPAFWMAQFQLPQNGPDGLKDQVYSYDCGPVHFAVLDSQQAEEKQYGNIFAPQEAWLDADLASSKAAWKIVLFHKTPYDVKDGRNDKEIREAFCPIIEKHHVDVVFCGHDHGIARTYPINSDVYMKKPSQGTVYFIAGRSGSKVYKNLSKRNWDTFFYNPLDQPNYLVVTVADKKLTVKAIKQDGTLIDMFFIDKKHDVDSDFQKK